jgi:hypothetical protein
LSVADIVKVADFMRLVEESPNARAVDTAWRRLNFGVSRERSEDGLLDYVIGIETVLNVDGGGEISRRICQRLAALIGTAEQRVEISSNMHKLYKERSSVAHRGSRRNVTVQARQAREYLERLIMAVLRLASTLKMPDLDNALLRGLGEKPYGN